MCQDTDLRLYIHALILPKILPFPQFSWNIA